MKKLYSKPSIIIENFEISEFIAGDCTQDVGFGDAGSTKLCQTLDKDSGFYIFNVDGFCETLWEDGENKGCYHISENEQGYFAS